MNAVSTIQQLPVMESFYTLQGEGFYQGHAAYFIRLGGCDVGCVWCDVKDSWDATKHPNYSVDEIIAKMNSDIADETVNRINQNNTAKPIVVITGGEPLMHNLDALTKALHNQGYKTNIETSGSHPLSGAWDWICLSPKKFKAPLPELVPQAHELKVVIFHKSDFEWAEQYAAQAAPHCKLYLQPEWDKAAQVTPLIINYIKEHPQWELSLQLHKYINVP